MTTKQIPSVLIHGWIPGFRKIDFTNMLQHELGMSLSSAKIVTDQILTKERVAIPVTPNQYERITFAAGELGAIVVSNEKQGKTSE